MEPALSFYVFHRRQLRAQYDRELTDILDRLLPLCREWEQRQEAQRAKKQAKLAARAEANMFYSAATREHACYVGGVGAVGFILCLAYRFLPFLVWYMDLRLTVPDIRAHVLVALVASITAMMLSVYVQEREKEGHDEFIRAFPDFKELILIAVCIVSFSVWELV